MGWSVAPMEGLGDLRFGMAPDEVSAVPGMDRRPHVYFGAGARRMDYRGPHAPVCEFEADRLVSVIVSPSVAGVLLDGLDPFAVAPGLLVQRLSARLGPPATCGADLCFRGGGLVLGGYNAEADDTAADPQQGDRDDRSLNLCAPGHCRFLCRNCPLADAA